MNFGKMMGGMAGAIPGLGGAKPGGMMGSMMGRFGQGGGSGGFNPRGQGASPFGQAMGARGMMGGKGMGSGMGGGGGGGAGAMAAGALLSDEHSKTRITELEDELQRTYAALGGTASTSDVQPEAPDTASLDAAYRKPTSNGYEYKDPSAPGAAPGRQAGPMADELKGIPGVVAPGEDGMDRVNTPRLTMANTSEIANLRREMDALMGRVGSGESNTDGTF